MRFAPLLFLFTLVSGSVAQATIGQTAPEVEKDYGPPLNIVKYTLGKYGCQDRTYETRGLRVIVTYWNGTSHREIYSRKREWTDQEIKNVMALNSAGGVSQVLSTSPTRVTFAFGDRLYATYNIRRGGAFFTVSTAELARAESLKRDEWFWRY